MFDFTNIISRENKSLLDQVNILSASKELENEADYMGFGFAKDILNICNELIEGRVKNENWATGKSGENLIMVIRLAILMQRSSEASLEEFLKLIEHETQLST